MSPKLLALRNKMKENSLDAYIIPSGDAHQSEEVSPYWRTREWFTGFTGSAGLVVITSEAAGLWTDGRYFIQAEKELTGSGIDLFRMQEEGVPTYEEWLAENLCYGKSGIDGKKGKIGFDGRVMSVFSFERLKEKLKEKHKEASFHYGADIAGNLWADRPPLPAFPAMEHDIRFTGLTSAEKLEAVRAQMKKVPTDLYLTAALDNIAWLANIRGNDIPNTPVAFAYLLVAMDTAYLFIENEKLPPVLRQRLESDGFTILPYESVFDTVKEKAANKSILYIPKSTSVQLIDSIPDTATSIAASKPSENIIESLKGIKNDTEISHIRNAFIKDGVVWVRLLKWLHETVPNSSVYETDVQEKIDELRGQLEDSIDASFESIVAYGENAALMHYSPSQNGEKGTKIEPEGLLLIDTGGQYWDGTTDVTRTIAMGTLTDEMRKDFTLVLKGNFALARTVFLQGSTGTHLDVIARLPIWNHNMDYKSGTGHGIGFCLGVHEGPHTISKHPSEVALVPGMLCTNEPGIYKKGRHGIRIENVLLVQERTRNEHGAFLGFETISFCPIDTRAVDASLLTQEELDYLNQYHVEVYAKLSPHLTEEEREWLKKITRPF